MELINFVWKKQISSAVWIWTGAQPIWKEWMEVQMWRKFSIKLCPPLNFIVRAKQNMNKVNIGLLSMNWNLYKIWLVH